MFLYKKIEKIMAEIIQKIANIIKKIITSEIRLITKNSTYNYKKGLM